MKLIFLIILYSYINWYLRYTKGSGDGILNFIKHLVSKVLLHEYVVKCFVYNNAYNNSIEQKPRFGRVSLFTREN
jgi:hypothetical protein